MIIAPSPLSTDVLKRGRRRASVPPPPAPLLPFTMPHFRAWAAGLLLDTGEPWHLEPFQEAFAADVFAGTAECWLIVPEGNGKTTLVAGLALYHTEFRPFATVAVAASSRDQAQVLYAQAEGFVLRSPRLHELVHSPIQEAKGKRKLEVPRFNPLPGYRRVDHHAGGRIQVYAADDATGDGLIPTLAILDELHRHRDLRLYRTWTGKLQKRQGQIVAISTAGMPGSEFEQTRERIRRSATEALRKGSFVRASSPRLVLHEWAVPEKADVEDFPTVKAANPFSGITVETLRSKFESPTMTLEHWRRFVCNLPTRGNNAAIQETEWAAAQTLDPIPVGAPISLGLDVAWKWDTTAAVPLWDGPGFDVLGDAAIIVPPRDGTMIHPDEVKRALLQIHLRNPIHTVVMDTSKAEDIAAWIESDIGATVIEWRQSLTQKAKDYAAFVNALRNGLLKHTGDAGLKQHVLNAAVRVLPSGDPVFERTNDSRGADQDLRVIDALVAAAMVVSAAAVPSEDAPVVEFLTL